MKSWKISIRTPNGGEVICTRALHQTKAAAWVWYGGKKRHVHPQWNVGMTYWYMGGLYYGSIEMGGF